MNVQSICHEMNGETFENYGQLSHRVLQHFNYHIFHFPRHYYYTQFLWWMRHQGWIKQTEDGWIIEC